MTAGWVAGTVRARALVRRRLGTAGARALVSAGSFAAAVEMLVHSPYGRFVRAGDDPTAAAHGVAATLLWNVRVLAGWLPARGSEMLRVLAGWFEIANTEEHLRALAGMPADVPYHLGALTTAWPRIAAAGSPEQVRGVLTASPWRDPGGSGPRDIQISLRLSWADRVAARVSATRPWALGAAALLLAREVVGRGEPLSGAARSSALRTLGPGCATSAASVSELRASLPRSAGWALDDVTDPEHLWQAEARWWRRVRGDSAALAARSTFGEEPVVGAVALLAHDAWLVTGALAGAGRDPDALEIFDAVT
ncbi:MAG TPA: hypothetical protein VH561_05725 [Micromonosporaceae bacterium]